MCVSLTNICADLRIEKGVKVHTIKEVLFFLVQLFWMLQNAVILASIVPRKSRTLDALLHEAAGLEARTG